MSLKKFTDLECEFHETASRRTGLVDFGDPEYRIGLQVLLEAIDRELQLTDAGWRYAYECLVIEPLIGRLYTQKGWGEHPEVFAIPVTRPLVIVGLARTGTTALHKLLSIDPQFQGLQYWLARTPMIRPPRETWEDHKEYRACLSAVDLFFRMVPEMLRVHEIVAGEVDECGTVLYQSFVFGGLYSTLPAYGRWCLTQSARQSYRRYADVLRLIGAREPHKRWLLKEPCHLADIEMLVEVFPDACIIQTHRDPLKAIPSCCSLRYILHRGLEGEAARPEVIGPRECAYWRKALDLATPVRRRVPGNFFDVDHRDFLADPLATVRSIYDCFGLTLTHETEEHMRAWIAASPTTRHGEHQYSIESWGVSAAQIRGAFAEYREQWQFDRGT